MTLLLADTKDQALLTMVIEEAQKTGADGRGYLGRTALQKIMYFLKVLEVPMSYRFDIHHHGPFCVDILNDAEILIADNVIKDESPDKAKYSDYKTSTSAKELLGKYSEDLDKHRGKVSTIVGAMVPLSPDRLELIATLDYAYRWVRATGGSGPWKKRVMQRFFEIKKDKKDKFPEQEVSQAYDSLVKAGLIQR